MKKLFIFILIFILISGCAGKPEIEFLEGLESDDTNYLGFTITGKDGGVIADVYVKYQENLSVAELSERICRAENIAFVTSGAGALRYVKGINNLFEFDEGPESGWVYSINGELMGVGSGSYIMQPGDYLVWHFTLELGRDIEAAVKD